MSRLSPSDAQSTTGIHLNQRINWALALGGIQVGGAVTSAPRIVLMGGNYVFKATPYYPPLDVVRKNAKAMAEGGWFFLSRWVSFGPGSENVLLPSYKNDEPVAEIGAPFSVQPLFL